MKETKKIEKLINKIMERKKDIEIIQLESLLFHYINEIKCLIVKLNDSIDNTSESQ